MPTRARELYVIIRQSYAGPAKLPKNEYVSTEGGLTRELDQARWYSFEEINGTISHLNKEDKEATHYTRVLSAYEIENRQLKLELEDYSPKERERNIL